MSTSVMEDLYATLGITKHATMDEIKRGYKRLALQHHPDKNPSPDAAKQFLQVQRSYEVLKDEHKRAIYDKGGADALHKFEERGEFPGFKSVIAAVSMWYACRFYCAAKSHVPHDLLSLKAQLRRWLHVKLVWTAVAAMMCVLVVVLLNASVVTPSDTGCRFFPTSGSEPFLVSLGNATVELHSVGSGCSTEVAQQAIEEHCALELRLLAASKERFRLTAHLEQVPDSPRIFKQKKRRLWKPKFEPNLFTVPTSELLTTLTPLCRAVSRRPAAGWLL